MRDYLEKINLALRHVAEGKELNQTPWSTRFTKALDRGYRIEEDEISTEKQKLLASFNCVQGELDHLGDRHPEIAGRLLRGALTNVGSKYTARFAVWKYLEETYPVTAAESGRADDAKIAEEIACKICNAIELEEVAIEGMAEVMERAGKQSRDIVVMSKDMIADELILRTFTEKYGVKAFVCCNGSTQQHAGILATATGAFLLVHLPGIVFDRLVKTGERVSLATSDTGFESSLYVGPSDSEIGMKIAQDVIVANTLKRYYVERARQADGAGIVSTLDPVAGDRAIVPVYANINIPSHLGKGDFGLEEEGALGRLAKAYKDGADGIALARTEYMYTGETPPDLDAQAAIYQGLADFDERVLTLRTFDKSVDDKECPALPYIGGSYGFDYYKTQPGRAALKEQLKAMFTAYGLSKYRNIRVMFPMIKTMEDINFMRGILDEIKTEIPAENRSISRETLDGIPLGIMAENKKLFEGNNLETILDNESVKISFVSIGTNDLISNVKGLSRGSVTNEHYDKEILSLIDRVTGEAARRNISVTICGDAARFSKTIMFDVYWYRKYGTVPIPGVMPEIIPKIKTLIQYCNAKNCEEMLTGWESKSDKVINDIVREKIETIIERIKKEELFKRLFEEEKRKMFETDSVKDVTPLVLVGVAKSAQSGAIAEAARRSLGKNARVVVVENEKALAKIARESGLTAIYVDDTFTPEMVRKVDFAKDVYEIKLDKEYKVILTMNTISDKTRQEIVDAIIALLGPLAAVDFDKAVKEFRAAPMTADKSAKIAGIRALVAERKAEIAGVYNNEPMPEAAPTEDKPIIIATTEKVAMSDIYFGENMTAANKGGITNALIYGDELKSEEEARQFVLASGYLGNMDDIKFIHKRDAVSELAGSENAGIRMAEGEFESTENSARVKAKILEIQAVNMNNQKVYAAMNSYQALLKMMISLEGELPPGVTKDEIRGIFKFLPRAIPIDYDKEVKAYIEAIAVIRTAA
jgi:phosphoenolpyruvate-protein kinase (PTS system EI component)